MNIYISTPHTGLYLAIRCNSATRITVCLPLLLVCRGAHVGLRSGGLRRTANTASARLACAAPILGARGLSVTPPRLASLLTTRSLPGGWSAAGLEETPGGGQGGRNGETQHSCGEAACALFLGASGHLLGSFLLGSLLLGSRNV